MGTLALQGQIINRSEWLLRHWFTTEVDHESGGIWPLLDPRLFTWFARSPHRPPGTGRAAAAGT